MCLGSVRLGLGIVKHDDRGQTEELIDSFIQSFQEYLSSISYARHCSEYRSMDHTKDSLPC